MRVFSTVIAAALVLLAAPHASSAQTLPPIKIGVVFSFSGGPSRSSSATMWTLPRHPSAKRRSS